MDEQISKSSHDQRKTFHSIDQFRQSSLDVYGKSNKFPLRPCVNILIILFSTIQVYILLNSRIYLRGQLVRTFLSVYVDQHNYPNLFAGNQFYLQITNIDQMKQHFEYLFERVEEAQNDSFIDLDYNDAKFVLHTEYKVQRDSSTRETVHQIDPKIGIQRPFNMHNITSIQMYLLQVEQFQLKVDNLKMKQNWEGFSEKYIHQITYQYLNSIKIRINFNFRIDNAMLNDDDDDDPRISQLQADTPYPTLYIIKVRIFYGFIMLLAIFSLYLNYIAIRTMFKVLYYELDNDESAKSIQSPDLLINEEIQYIREDVRKWVKANNITINELQFKHYINLLQFDVIFSVMANVFGVIAGFYLLTGIQRERMAGIACLFSWMTIFKFLRKNKKLVLMYELIKMSFTRVLLFFVQFLPVFLSYAVLGVCLFPKVGFFSSLADSVTTLVCLMMGDSIEMITNAIIEKNSLILAILYIFSFVLMFMHAIHNTLTSLIKQFFIIKKIQLVKQQKQRLKETDYLYIDQLQTQSDKMKNKLPLKLTSDMQKSLLRIKFLKKTEGYGELIKFYCSQIDRIRQFDGWIIKECNLGKIYLGKEQLIRRATYCRKIINKIPRNSQQQPPYINMGHNSMMTDEN